MPRIATVSSEWLIGCAISAIAYTLLFYFNNWLTSGITFGAGVSWIYLPAGLRLFLTLIFGFPGAVGIALASFLISDCGKFSGDLTVLIGIGLISGFAPYLAKMFVFNNLYLEADLSNLSFKKLMICILIYALLSASLHQWWFATMALENTGSVNHFLVMFIGDVLGSLLLISLIKYSLDLLKRIRKTAY
jgi:hypothetical protein